MKKKRIVSVVAGLIGGALLGLLLLLVSDTPYMSPPDETTPFMILTVIGCAIAAATLLLRNRSVKQTLLRTAVLLANAFASLRLLALAGVADWLDGLFQAGHTEVHDHAAGLRMGAFFFLVLLVCAAICLALLVAHLVRAREQRLAEEREAAEKWST